MKVSLPVVWVAMVAAPWKAGLVVVSVFMPIVIHPILSASKAPRCDLSEIPKKRSDINALNYRPRIRGGESVAQGLHTVARSGSLGACDQYQSCPCLTCATGCGCLNPR